MKTTSFTFAALLVLVPGCSEDNTNTGNGKTEIDAEEQQMSLDPDGDGVAEGTVEGSTASMTFTLEEPLPESVTSELGDDAAFRGFDATEDEVLSDIVDALSVTVSSPRSGVSVTLAGHGTLVTSPPMTVGEWSVTLDDSRTAIDVQWYNGAGGSLTLKEGFAYDVVYSLGTNCCIEAVEATSMRFMLGG